MGKRAEECCNDNNEISTMLEANIDCTFVYPAINESEQKRVVQAAGTIKRDG